jgi:hypothetical protein
MFDVTPDEIAGLNDEDLRTLVALLCEAEASLRGLPRSAVTWGGNQTAPDGGLDVRVSLRQDAPVEGFIPRFSTGIQVKKPDMRPRDIIREMRPAGLIRPVIQELADEGGAYLIISSGASTSDRALRERCSAMREALADVANAERLHVEFYDRTRLATAVRSHPGLVTWVKERAGRSLVGWRPYGPWSGVQDNEYLLDNKLRLRFRDRASDPGLPAVEGINRLRGDLAQAGNVIRLVGLSLQLRPPLAM